MFAKIHHRRHFFAVYDQLHSAVILFDSAFGENDAVRGDRDVFAADNIFIVSAVRDRKFFRIELKLIIVRSEIIGYFHAVGNDIILADRPARRFASRYERGNQPRFQHFVFVGNVLASEIYPERNIPRNLLFDVRVNRKLHRFARICRFGYRYACDRDFGQRFRILLIVDFTPRHARRRADHEALLPGGIVVRRSDPVGRIEPTFSSVEGKKSAVGINAHLFAAFQRYFQIEKHAAVIRFVIHLERESVFAYLQLIFDMRDKHFRPRVFSRIFQFLSVDVRSDPIVARNLNLRRRYGLGKRERLTVVGVHIRAAVRYVRIREAHPLRFPAAARGFRIVCFIYSDIIERHFAVPVVFINNFRIRALRLSEFRQELPVGGL